MNLHEAVNGQLNQAQLDARVNPKNYRTIDWDTFKHLEGNAIRLPNGLAPSISAVAYLSGYTESGGALFDFPLNDAGLPWVEAYLTRMVKPYIRRWGKCHRPAYRSQGVIGILEPADDRRNEASA